MNLYTFSRTGLFGGKEWDTVKADSYPAALGSITDLRPDAHDFKLEGEMPCPVEMITTNAGDSRTIEHYYGNGAFDCPFCGYNTRLTTCENPWCDAHPQMTVAIILERQAEREKKRQEEERRKRDNAFAMQRIASEHESKRAWEFEQIAEAKRRGACLRCLFVGYKKVKFVKHRGACAKEKR